jgi:hypothetical protein
MNCTRDMLALGIDLEDDEAVENYSLEVLMHACKAIRKIVPDNVRLIFNGMPTILTKNIQMQKCLNFKETIVLQREF